MCLLALDSTIRTRIREALPARTFTRQPLRSLWFLPLVTTTAGGTWLIMNTSWPWYANLAIAVVLGQAYAATLFLAHEALHGALVGPGLLRTTLGCLGFAPFLISPRLWIAWHNRAHHGHANDPDLDPDVFVVRGERDSVATRLAAWLAPGSGSLASYVWPFYWFTVHGQIVLLWLSREFPPGYGLNRKRAAAETSAFAAGLVLLLYCLDGTDRLWAVIVPLTIANAIAMSYIGTNHLIREQQKNGAVCAVTASVRTHECVDRLHFRFSHHVEHHLFPRMAGKFAPGVRRLLESEYSHLYVAPSHGAALRELYRGAFVLTDGVDARRELVSCPSDP